MRSPGKRNLGALESARARFKASTNAWFAPCPLKGDMGCAASPRSVVNASTFDASLSDVSFFLPFRNTISSSMSISNAGYPDMFSLLVDFNNVWAGSHQLSHRFRDSSNNFLRSFESSTASSYSHGNESCHIIAWGMFVYVGSTSFL